MQSQWFYCSVRVDSNWVAKVPAVPRYCELGSTFARVEISINHGMGDELRLTCHAA